MLTDTLIFIIHAVFGFFASVLLLRFWLQWCRAATRNPLSEFVQTLTNFAVLPARRVIPSLWGLDLATLILAWLVLVVEIVLIILVRGSVPGLGPSVGAVLIMALLMMVRMALYLAIGVIILQVILSWVNPSSPAAPVVSALTRPVLAPIQRIVPLIGNIDLSPLIALLLLQLILAVPLAYLERGFGVGF
jgi:YggT family protein